MFKYAIIRLINMVPTVIGATFIVFWIFHIPCSFCGDAFCNIDHWQNWHWMWGW